MNNQPQPLKPLETQDHDGMMQNILKEKYCEHPEYVRTLVNALINAKGKESLNSKWEIKTIYLTGSEIRKFYQNEKIIRYILSQILGRPFKLSFKDRHNLQLIVLR